MKKISYSVDKPVTHVGVQIKSSHILDLVKDLKKNQGVTANLGDFVVYAIAKSLKKFPEFNSNYSEGLAVYPNINIGFSINLGQGAKMAVIPDADKKSITDVVSEIKKLALKYIHKELNDEDALNCTFSVSNLSAFDSYTVSTPVYNTHSSMISICSEFDSFEVKEEKVIPSKKFNVNLSYDSRVADCQKAILFLNSIKDALEGKTTL